MRHLGPGGCFRARTLIFSGSLHLAIDDPKGSALWRTQSDEIIAPDKPGLDPDRSRRRSGPLSAFEREVAAFEGVCPGSGLEGGSTGAFQPQRENLTSEPRSLLYRFFSLSLIPCLIPLRSTLVPGRTPLEKRANTSKSLPKNSVTFCNFPFLA